jgi:hypothetical protein
VALGALVAVGADVLAAAGTVVSDELGAVDAGASGCGVGADSLFSEFAI